MIPPCSGSRWSGPAGPANDVQPAPRRAPRSARRASRPPPLEAGWTEPARDEWATLQAELLAGDAWIADGNYGGTFDLRFARADTVIVLTLPPLRCVAGVVRRWATHFGRDVQARGCPEHVDLAFLRWIWRYPKDSRPRLDAAIARHREHLRVVELRSRREAAAFLDELDDPRRPRAA